MHSIEQGIQSDHCRVILPMMESQDNRESLFDRLLSYDMPWIAKRIKEEAGSDSSEALVKRYENAIAMEK